MAVEGTRHPSAELYDRVELIPGKLDFASLKSTKLRDNTTATLSHGDEEEYTCMDGDLVYARFFADFGPLHLSRTVRFCRALESRLGLAKGPDGAPVAAKGKRVVLYCSDHPHKRANATTLLAIFLVVAGGLTPELAVTRVLNDGKLSPPFGFRDASSGVCTFFITLLDCARAMHKAIASSLWSYQVFSVDEYDHLDRLENGDINWIVPGKLVAFSGPQRERIMLDAESGAATLLARDYATVFHDIGVTCVIRFNEASTYDRKAFTHAGLRHIDMPFPDGSNPSDEILYKFIRVCERETGAVAVHCKAGLGRTGTAIAAFLMKNYRFAATEAIAWCRICRPGCIVGPQQHFLTVKQPQLHSLPSIFEVQPVANPSQPAQQQPRKNTMHSKLERLPRHQANTRVSFR
ncbi:Dual specificity protein phosphatase cdc14a [Phytophthora pseudosyringae]|uniref:protein-tyrosine-phosphatase n=1 Tax=Phytophthora pseudosyringae TaxID=221518 RepID=A0A8T1VEE5_9STRA|nr:Dual specificity protein phosphatase cdc14a [Phytophthora pseudosyringae]